MNNRKQVIAIVVALYISCVICLFITTLPTVQNFVSYPDFGYYLIMFSLIGSGLVGLVSGVLIARNYVTRANPPKRANVGIYIFLPLLFGVLFFGSITIMFLVYGIILWSQSY